MTSDRQNIIASGASESAHVHGAISLIVNARTDSPIRIAIVGFGKMGHEIERLAPDNGMDVVERFDIATPLRSVFRRPNS